MQSNKRNKEFEKNDRDAKKIKFTDYLNSLPTLQNPIMVSNFSLPQPSIKHKINGNSLELLEELDTTNLQGLDEILQLHPNLNSLMLLKKLMPFQKKTSIDNLQSLVNILQGHPNITSLHLSSNGLEDNDIEILFANSNMTSLDLSYNNITIKSLEYLLNHLPNLIQLDISSCGKIDISKISILKNFSNLKCLTLQSLELNFEKIKNLIGIDLEQLNISHNRIGLEGLEFICQNFRSLTKLHAENIALTKVLVGNVIKSMSSLSLLELDLSQNLISAGVISSISTIVTLEKLNLLSTYVEKDWLSMLAKLPKLITLDLSYNRLSMDVDFIIMNFSQNTAVNLFGTRLYSKYLNLTSTDTEDLILQKLSSPHSSERYIALGLKSLTEARKVPTLTEYCFFKILNEQLLRDKVKDSSHVLKEQLISNMVIKRK